MLLISTFVVMLVTETLSANLSAGSGGSNCGFGFEFLEHRLEQLEYNQLNGFSELNSTLQTQSILLERLAQGLKSIVDRQQKRIIQSCEEVSQSGRYRLQQPNRAAPVTVLCDNESFDGGWLVIQYRFDGTVDFNRSWAEYRDGFGIVGSSSEFWLGLETVHQLTKSGDHELLVQLKNETGASGFARYRMFKIAGEDEGYRLAPLGNFSGTIFNRLNYSRDEQFSAYDRDVDQLEDGNCAQIYGGGWWFYRCGWTTLNGSFKRDSKTGRGIYWEDWTNAATYSRMMIRRK